MHHRFSGIIVFILSLIASGTDAQSSLGIYNTDLFIGEGANVTSFGDFHFESESPVQNEGRLEINAADREIMLNNISTFDVVTGNGEFILKPENNINLAGNDWKLTRLTLDGYRDVSLQTNLTITDKLTLQKGRIVGNNYVTCLLNPDDAIVFDNSEENTSYISGDLRLHVRFGATVRYSLGDECHFRPIDISNYLEHNEWIQVSYSPANISSRNPDVIFLSHNWWNISLENSSANGYINAAIPDYNFNLNTMEGNVYIAPIHVSTEGIVEELPYFFDEKSQQTNKDDNNFVIEDIRNPGHMNLADVSALRIIMPNYLRIENHTANYFIIPNIDLIGNAEITIFSRLGNILFESDNYQNDFDFTDFPKGTYYYTISFTIQGEIQNFQSFIELI